MHVEEIKIESKAGFLTGKGLMAASFAEIRQECRNGGKTIIG